VADSPVPPAPPTPRGDDVDLLHGVPVADPYRWLEDGDAADVAAWVAAHNRRTRQALDARPHRDRWLERLAALMALPTAMSAEVRGDRVFATERAPGADQFALVLRSADGGDAPPRVLLDPASLAADGAAAIDWFWPSPDGRLVAYGVSEGGTEDSVLRILEVDTGEHLADVITDTRACTVAWLPDGSGFWYTRYPAGEHYRRHVRFHRRGDDPATDPIVFDRLPTEQSWPDVSCSPDGRHVLVTMLVGWGQYDLHLLDTTTGEWRVVVEGVEQQTGFVFHDGWLVGVTTLDAPSGRLIAAHPDHPGEWITLVPERPGVVLGRVAGCGDRLLVTASIEAVDRVDTYQWHGGEVPAVTQEDPLPLPEVMAVQSLDADDGRVALVVATFDAPPQLWVGDTLQVRPCSGADRPDAVPELVVQHLHYPSRDGTPIGLFVVHRADVVPSADTPLVLTGYGGFAISEPPAWMPNLVTWAAAGGVFAVAGLRGGFEHGEDWHRAGRRANKQNVFDDFHAAADWLVEQRFTARDRLAVVGGSNGGLLVGAALTQRPDLARAVWCAVPLLDMIRFPQFLIARLWTDEYGDPDVAEEFAWLHAYSPYHRVVPGTRYPAVLFTTAEGDTRVDPLHARKMAALLVDAAADQDERPVLLMQHGRAGHGVGKPASMRVAEGADVLTFLAWQLGGPQQ
jgi:prolyl oligopeptidase